jgi:signal transduction histidine kinase/AraC-like DNA-binding protein/CheY-like chemotaxis protein
MWPAILGEAARRGVNLVCFPGGRLDEKTEFENQRNAVFEAGNRDGSVYEELRAYLSSALRGITLYNEAENARKSAEKADIIKTRLLANVSHELRSPLNLILGHVRNAERRADSDLLGELAHIEANARNQLRVVNDLLDLSRAEIDELDLHMEYLDIAPILRGVFQDFTGSLEGGGTVEWRLDVPIRLPLVLVDPARLRQILLNLLSNSARHTVKGVVEIGATIEPERLHLWVRDSGCGIPADQQERIFEPFVSSVSGSSVPGGIGLGLSIARHMVALHLGQLTLDSELGRGSTFHVNLPLPNLARSTPRTAEGGDSVLVCISHAAETPSEIKALAASSGLPVILVSRIEDLELRLPDKKPAILAWDMAGAQPGDWLLIKRLRQFPTLFQTPFMAFGAPGTGMTGFLSKTPHEENLLDIIARACPAIDAGPVFIVDDEPEARDALAVSLAAELCGHRIRVFGSGKAALEAMESEIPGLVILDFAMPELNGADVLDRMRMDMRLTHVPVMVLSNKAFDSEDIARLERNTRVVLQHKGVWTEAETGASVSRILYGAEFQPAHASALVKRALLYLNGHYSEPITRWQVAGAVNVSEDYLSRIFSRELGISPWDYLIRYRVWQAGRLLVGTGDSIGVIAARTGFSDQAYFSRVFRKITGQTP